MMDRLITWDEELFLFLNRLHSPGLDQPMYFLTNTWAWIPLYALLLYFIYRKYGAESWLYVVGIAATVAIANTITSEIMKPLFLRPRPTYNPAFEGVLHIVNDYKGGRYGFASSHAANTFGVATFVWLLLRENIRWIVLLFSWAGLVTYSRIYLGVHYPGDIIAGAFVGALTGWLCLRMTFQLRKKYLHHANG